MYNMLEKLRCFLTSEDGPTAVEYAVMLALIVVACIVVIQNLATQVQTTFNSVSSTMSSAS
jgi:pilus assembly protein Flp/PilA